MTVLEHRSVHRCGECGALEGDDNGATCPHDFEGFYEEVACVLVSTTDYERAVEEAERLREAMDTAHGLVEEGGTYEAARVLYAALYPPTKP